VTTFHHSAPRIKPIKRLDQISVLGGFLGPDFLIQIRNLVSVRVSLNCKLSFHDLNPLVSCICAASGGNQSLKP
jgi:hypothetical protein